MAATGLGSKDVSYELVRTLSIIGCRQFSMGKKDGWFCNYEQRRDYDSRIVPYADEDFSGSRVIDVGCNTGQMCRHAAARGATYVLGVDYDNGAIENARKLAAKHDNIEFMTDDLDNYLFYASLPDFDTCLFLSVIGTKELQHRHGILARLAAKTQRVMYIEGHRHVFRKEEILKAVLEYTTFTTIEYLGLTFDNEAHEAAGKSRDLFRCSRDMLSWERSIEALSNLLSGDEDCLLLVQGHGGTGKSTLRRHLIEHLTTHTRHKFESPGWDGTKSKGTFASLDGEVCVLDDVSNPDFETLKGSHKRLVCFDYRALEYAGDHEVDALFITSQDAKTRFEKRPKYKAHRTPPIDRFVGSVYHVEPF